MSVLDYSIPRCGVRVVVCGECAYAVTAVVVVLVKGFFGSVVFFPHARSQLPTNRGESNTKGSDENTSEEVAQNHVRREIGRGGEIVNVGCGYA